MPKTPYSDVTSQEALRLMVNGEEAECLESEEKWRRYKLKKIKDGGLCPVTKLLYHKKGEWREAPHKIETLASCEWRVRRKPMMVVVTDQVTNSLNGSKSLHMGLDESLAGFPDGARVQVTIKELLGGASG